LVHIKVTISSLVEENKLPEAKNGLGRDKTSFVLHLSHLKHCLALEDVAHASSLIRTVFGERMEVAENEGLAPIVDPR